MINAVYYASVTRLYKLGRINAQGVAVAVAKGWLTAEQYEEITGETYVV